MSQLELGFDWGLQMRVQDLMSQLIILIGVSKWGLRAYANQCLIFPWWELFLGGLCASGWGNVKNFFENVLLAGEMLKVKNQLLTFPQWERFWGGCVLLAGEMLKTFLKKVLLAGEMLKSEKPTFNISPVGAFFGWVVCFWLGNVKAFLKMCLWLGKC